MVFLSFMEIVVTHTVYFHFHLISKFFLSFLSFWSVCLSQMYSRKDNSSTKGKTYFEPSFQLSRKMNWDNSKNSSESILEKKKERGYQQCGILFSWPFKTMTWSKLPMSIILWVNWKNLLISWEPMCLLIIVQINKALWCFLCLLTEKILVETIFPYL